MTINILTLFPDYFTSAFAASILGKAQQKELVKINIINIRDFADDKHKTTDDRPFGGGAGMVMKIEPIYKALQSIGVKKGQPDEKIILTSAKGKSFDQQIATSYSKLKTLTIICGHYEGVDERVAENLIDGEIRIGDYVLTGGEPATSVITDAVIRLIPEVLGNEESNKEESHSLPGKMTHPTYTRPEEFKDWAVPKVLLSGDHGKIEKWREEETQ
jgi:tRNA (guanine37-N1)-methyltransferase